MRPAARMPKLTRRSRILIAIALAVVLLLLIGPRLVDAYVDWLWFGELGYRSVFTTMLFTRLIVFLVVGAARRRASCSPALALAYRTRPVFVPTSGPNDPGRALPHRGDVAAEAVRHRHPRVHRGLRRASSPRRYWVRVQLFLHGGSFGVNDPQFGMDLGFYAFDLPFYRLVLTYLFVATFLAFIANLLGPLPLRRHPAGRAAPAR